MKFHTFDIESDIDKVYNIIVLPKFLNDNITSHVCPTYITYFECFRDTLAIKTWSVVENYTNQNEIRPSHLYAHRFLEYYNFTLGGEILHNLNTKVKNFNLTFGPAAKLLNIKAPPKLA